MLSAQPHRCHGCKQKDVKRELGLEEQAISTSVMDLGKGTHGKTIFQREVTELAAAGLYRVVGGKWG